MLFFTSLHSTFSLLSSLLFIVSSHRSLRFLIELPASSSTCCEGCFRLSFHIPVHVVPFARVSNPWRATLAHVLGMPPTPLFSCLRPTAWKHLRHHCLLAFDPPFGNACSAIAFFIVEERTEPIQVTMASQMNCDLSQSNEPSFHS